ncbi:MAG TPA: phospholipase D-like domain-containing protein [Leptospiraceae bacterium]|nr:phospholipase D-like domain-containing protein [Leptospiraceae bacterium]HMY67107.1 phospholipase D-like domain-containing protein [Leptospiraceae bacterium]HNF25807.1 phospholipase D-like domain-containing protein [Leptospiraceae bacterium]HNI98056.1 phospholipase D-like domain-containing protein [Leptospiraceae bacterium]HNO23275.1 phospholipase D-like domain-containing protein [Leptospiraceae bacterium]
MRRLFILPALLAVFCSSRKKTHQLPQILFPSFSIKAFFSYPGKFEDPIRKRHVLDHILSLIKGSEKSLRFYVYSFNHPEIVSELKAASGRGVKIEIQGDRNTDYSLLKKNGIPYRVWSENGIHHLKIIISDEKKLFLGTGNFSFPGITNDWNGFIQLPLDKNEYIGLLSFLEGRSPEPGISIGGFSFMFSPEKGVLIQDRIIEEIRKASKSIDYLAFDHYDEAVSHALKERSSQSVRVRGVYNDPADPEGIYLNEELYGIFPQILKDGNTDTVEVPESEFGAGGLLHHKTIIIDGRLLISGSFNFSSSARDQNREVIYFTEDNETVSEFISEFDRIYRRSYIIPKKNYQFSRNEAELAVLSETDSSVCFDKTLKAGTAEVGAFPFRTVLYYPNQNSSCISKAGYDSVSTGISNFRREYPMSNSELWKKFIYSERTGNRVFSRNENSVLQNISPLSAVHFSGIDFSAAGKLFLDLKTDLSADSAQIIYWSPGNEFRSASGSVISGKRISAVLNVPASERDKGMLIIRSPEKNYFGCFVSSGISSNALDFISAKLQDRCDTLN